MKNAKFFSVALLLLAPAAGALEPAFVAQSPIVKVDGDQCCGAFTKHAVMAPDSSFVAIWYNQDELKARRFSASGLPLTAELDLGLAGISAVAGRPDGSFLVIGYQGGEGVWSFDAQGNGGPPLVAPGFLPAISWSRALAHGPDGSFFLAYGTVAPPNAELHLRHFDAAGQPLGPARVVATQQQGHNFNTTAVSAAADGQVQVVWEHRQANGLAGSGHGVFRRRYDAALQPLGEIEALISDAYIEEARTAVAPDGRILMAFWTGGSEQGQLAIGGAAAVPQGQAGPLSLWQEAFFYPVVPAPAFLSGSDLAVATDGWLFDERPTIHLIRARADGQPAGPRLQVTPPVPGVDFLFPAVATHGDRLVVLWSERRDIPSGHTGPIAFQVFDATLFADGFETGGTGSWTVVQ